MAGNNNTAVATRQDQSVAPSAFEKAIMFGDISGLDERGRMDYVAKLCESLGLNPLGRAFAYINFGQGLTCYLTSMGASQLRTVHGISTTKVEDHGVVDDFYRITITGGTLNGRTDIEFGSIAMRDKSGNPIVGLGAENARKKCLTQAKSRLTKSLVGLSGMPSEDEKDDFGERWSAGPTPESLAARTVNAPQVEDTKPAGPLATDPMPEEWRGGLFEFTKRLHSLTGALTEIPDQLTRKEARALIASLKEQIAAAEAAQESEPELVGV